MDNLLKEDFSKMDGNKFLDLSIAVLMRLRSDFHGDGKTQESINNILTTLYNIKF